MCQVVARGFRQDGMLIIRSSNYCGWSHSLASGEPRATLHQTRNPWAMWSRARSAGRQLLRGALGAYCAPPTHPGFQRSAKGCSWDGWARQPARSCISIETRMGRGRIGVRHATRKPTKCCLNNSVNRIVLHAAPLNVAPWHVVAAPAYGFFLKALGYTWTCQCGHRLPCRTYAVRCCRDFDKRGAGRLAPLP